MAGFTSILFPHGGAPKGVDAAPDCFPDLHLDEIIAAVTAGHADDHVDRFFYVPLHDVSTVEHRHQVFRDLERDQTHQTILNFVDGMRTMRRRLHQAKQLSHPLQRHGWLIYAVQTYCDTVAMLRDDLAHVEPGSRGLRDFADYLAEYVESDSFKTLVADTDAVQAEAAQGSLHRAHPGPTGPRREVSKAKPITARESWRRSNRFATEAGKDYHVPSRNSPT